MWAVCTRDCVAVAVDRVNPSTRVSATAAEAPLPSPVPRLRRSSSPNPSNPNAEPRSPRPRGLPRPPAGPHQAGRQALVTWIGAAGIVLRRKPSCRAGSVRPGWLVWSGLGGLSGSWRRSRLGNSGSWWNWSR